MTVLNTGRFAGLLRGQCPETPHSLLWQARTETPRKLGRFERANGGTLFLDEIGDLPQQSQAMLLRVLQERKLERVGGTEAIKIDIHLVAATNHTDG